MAKPAIVFALYKPHAGNEAALYDLVAGHHATLLKYELVTSRAPIICRSANATIIEVFEWNDAAAHKRAHEHPEIASLWERMEKLGEMPKLGTLPECANSFPHFEPLA